MAELVLRDLRKEYDKGVVAVQDFNLHIQDKEFIVFVGPSGCGKSTTLRMIAGLEEISEGDFEINGTRMNDVAPKNRDIAMVFQNYALYPHMTVYENMAFSLKLRKVNKTEIDERVQNAARILGLEDYLKRKPKALSGGQRQRVALGRAIVRDAKIFLMDEPLSNLDAKLRVQMRAEIQKLHRRLQTTTIYVTHDQTEAMTMASRIVVMKDGLIQQVGTPKEVYDEPVNMFVGGFIGSPAMNFLHGELTEQGFRIGTETIQLNAAHQKTLADKGYVGKPLALGIRPEHIYSSAEEVTEGEFSIFDATVDVAELMGAETFVYAELHGSPFVARIDATEQIAAGQTLRLKLDTTRIHFFDPTTEMRIS